MSRDTRLRLQDIVEACLRQEHSRVSLDYQTFLNDEDAVDAAFARLTIIGEAINALPAELLDRYADIPWQRIIGMRNYLVHVYFGVNLHVLWDTVTVEVPKLRAKIEEIIAELYPPADTENNN